MDREKQAAIRTLQRAGLTAEELMAFVPEIRHIATTRAYGPSVEMLNLERGLKRYHAYWDKLPELQFDAGWRVVMRPPIGGAIVRFLVRSGNRKVSVYFDADGNIGASVNYWEIYPAENGDVERFAMLDADGLLDGIRRSLEAR